MRGIIVRAGPLMYFSPRETVRLVSETLEKTFPGVLFAVRLVAPVLDGPGEKPGRKSIEVVWLRGPGREAVADAVERFQGIAWDPRTGQLRPAVHWMVDADGNLRAVRYGADYIFCEGPLDA